MEQIGGLPRDEEETVLDVMCAISQGIKSFPELLVIFFRERRSATTDSIIASQYSPSSGRYEDNGRPSSPTPSTSTSTSHGTTSLDSSAFPRRKSTHNFPIFSYLLRFVHREGRVGDFARAGLLALIDVAMSSVPPPPSSSNMDRSDTTQSYSSGLAVGAAREAKLALGEFLLDSDFAEVLGAGLGALYGLLPGKLLVRTGGSSTGVGEESTVDGFAGGMVLGGMGALGEDDDPEAAKIRREEEENGLRALGVGISGTADFREGLDGWLKLIEFTQEILRRSPVERYGEMEEELDEAVRLQQIVVSSLVNSILSSVRSLFLQNVLYPSILGCSDGDGSAVAVLSYLDSMLEVVEEGTVLGATILGFLMGEEDIGDFARRQGKTSKQKKAKVHPQSALVLLESTSVHARRTPAYLDSFGRFTIKDLLVSNIQSSSQTTSTAALKLVRTMLAKHDRWSMGILDVVLDDAATSFPVAARNEVQEEEVLEEEDEEFVYPDPDALSTPSRSSHISSTPSRTPLPRLLLGTPIPSTPSIKTHLNTLDSLLALVDSIDPAYRSARLQEAGSVVASTGFSNYLHDAEQAIASDRSFRRGLIFPLHNAQEEPLLSPQARRRSTLFGGPPKLSPRDFASVKTGRRHRLDPSSSKVVELLLESFGEFFSHSPELNLALTAVFGSLAVSPYRSLEGWVFPLLERDTNKGGRHERVRGRRDGIRQFDDDSQQSPLANTTSPSTPFSMLEASSLLDVLSALAESVSQYRFTISGFDGFLADRRKGLMFVDNLADALVVSDESFSGAIKNLAVQEEPKPPPTKSKGIGFGSFLPSRSPTLPPTNQFLTPPRTRSASSISESSTIKPGPISPFAAHYRQTGSIAVSPIIIPLGTPRKEAEESSLDAAPDTPTKRLSPLPPPPSSPGMSGSSSTGMEDEERKERIVPTVTLSAILDNVIILEEFIKELGGIVAVRRALGIDGVSLY